MWIFFSFLSSALYSVANVLDSHLSNNLFSRKLTLIFYANFFSALFLPILFVFLGLPDMPDGHALLLFLVLALLNIGYMYPYYKAFETSDTSVVISLFSLTNLFIPVLAFFIVGERLDHFQYLGVGIVVLSAVSLGRKRGSRMRLSTSFWWMLLCSGIVSLEAVLYKYAFEETNWITGFAWPAIFSFALVLPLLFFARVRKDIFVKKAESRKYFSVFAAEEATAFLATAAATYASSIGSVTIVGIISELQPMFVLLWARLFARRAPHVFREESDGIPIRKKMLLFASIIIGIALTLWER